MDHECFRVASACECECECERTYESECECKGAIVRESVSMRVM